MTEQKLKVYGWTGSAQHIGQTRNIIAASSVAEVLRLTGLTRSEWNNSGDETGNDAEITMALTEPGVEFIQPLNALAGDLWSRADGKPITLPEPRGGAIGTIITDNGTGYPLTRAIGGWVRPGWNKPRSWAEVLEWHQDALDDDEDDTDAPFRPVVMVPEGRRE